MAVAALAAATLVTSSANAASVLDQNSAPGGGAFNESLDWQQQVTAGITGKLVGITLYGDGTALNVGVSAGDAFQAGPYAFSSGETLSASGTFIDVSAANIFLTAGDHFIIDMSGGSNGNLLASTTAYTGGDLFLNFGIVSDFTQQAGYSMAFQTFMSVPEPASWALMLVGFGSLGAVLRRRRSQAICAA
jgi:hypothetical protein